MEKVQLAIPQDLEEDFLLWVQDKEIFQLTQLADDTDGQSSHSLDFQLAQIQFALEFIGRIRAELAIDNKKGIKNLFAQRPTSTLAALEQTIARLDLDKILTSIRSLNDDLGELEELGRARREAAAEVAPWRSLTVTGAALFKTDYTRHALLTVNAKEEMLVKRLLEDISTAAWQEIHRDVIKRRGTVYLQVVIHAADFDQLETILSQSNAALVTLLVPDDLTVTAYAESLDAEIIQIKEKRVALFEKARSFVKLERDLQLAYDALLHRQERDRAVLLGRHMPYSVIYEGWMPQDSLVSLEQGIEDSYPAVALMTVESDKDPAEVPPVALKNSRLMEPFETITGIYGRPKYWELDPTVYLSLFFLVAFGLALTDAGYGIVMMAGMWAVEKFFRLKREMRKMVRLMFYAGFSTLIFGALTGGWFGITLANLPAGGVKNLLLAVKVIDPISTPITLLMVAFAFGIVQLLFAWMVRGYDHYRQRDYVALLFDDVAWISMVVFILMWVGTSRGLLPANLTEPFKWAIFANAGVLILSQGRSHKNPLLKLGTGLLSLYGLIGFLSDMLSYSRLLALGLATGIIALVVNLIGTMVSDGVPYVGWLLAVIVLLGGHTFNLGINALGAFIHSGRLQFVEFIPKFMEGGGAPWQPLGRISKYVDNPKDFES